MKKIFLLSLVSAIVFFGVDISTKKNKRKMNDFNLEAAKAFAATALSPGSISTATVSGRALWVKFFTYIMTGYDGTPYTISDSPGPTGIIGLVNSIVGSSGIGGCLYLEGITQCSDIMSSLDPVTCTSAGTTYDVSFDSPTETIPAHFASDAGSSYSVRINVATGGADYMKVELKCDTSNVQSGFIRADFDEGGGATREILTHFQQNTSSNAGNVDFYMYLDSSDERVVKRFVTTDGDTYRLYFLRSEGGTSYNAFGMHGKSSENVAAADQILTSNTTNIGSVTTNGSTEYSECLNTSSESTSTDCTSLGLSVSTYGSLGSMDSSVGTSTFNTTDIDNLALPALSTY